MALAHGLVAATGLGFLIYEMSITTVPPLATLGLVFLLLAALGGALMFFGFDLQGKALPIPLMLGHGLMAVAGFVMLLIYHYQAHEAGLRP